MHTTNELIYNQQHPQPRHNTTGISLSLFDVPESSNELVGWLVAGGLWEHVGRRDRNH